MSSGHIYTASYLRGEHVDDAVYRTLEQESTSQETNEHHIGEQRAEVHHLQSDITKQIIK